ncbi:hypothetical protein JOQ06_029097 [Pogonophryne albipinna]|uniref:Uncharacterized protein n=1 Tax=Pogonophryne albipinna TaxID=1090488 RepID=A0AAD6BBB1_9TELE|nr:hypothetical protein JOQ06_029097 [Pogonophryne albipinna]
MDLWALQTSRPNPNPCPLPWVSDYKLAAGDGGWARDGVYPQVRPPRWASLGARWPHCQQAGPALIKDVEPNWSRQHLLPLNLGG